MPGRVLVDLTRPADSLEPGIATRRGPMRAIVAIEHAMIIAGHNMLTNGDFYCDPGADYYTAHQPARTKSRAINQLETLGYRVTLEPLTESA